MPPNTSKTAKPQTPCPLFPDTDPPVCAEEIKEVRVYYVTYDKGGREQRKLLPRSQHRMEINFYETTDQDFVDSYPPGRYYVEPISLEKTRRMEGGHHIDVPDPSEFDGSEEDDEDDTSPFPGMQPPVPPSSNPEMMNLFKELLRDKERTAKEQVDMLREHTDNRTGMYENFTKTMMQSVVDGRRADAPNGDVVAILREQVDEIRKKSVRDEEDIRKNYRDDLARRDRELEDMRRSHRDELSRRDRELDEIRGDFKKREEELRRRGTSEEDEVRKKWRDEVADLRTKYERELNEARGYATEMRTRMQAEIDRVQRQVYDLQKENLELAKELASTPDEPPAPSAPMINPNGIPEDAPSWVKTGAALLSTPAGMKAVEGGMKAVERVATTIAEEARRPAPQPQPQFTTQQYAPPPQQFAPTQQPYIPPQPAPQTIPPPPVQSVATPYVAQPSAPVAPAAMPTQPVSTQVVSTQPVPAQPAPTASPPVQGPSPASVVRPFSFENQVTSSLEAEVPVVSNSPDRKDEGEDETENEENSIAT